MTEINKVFESVSLACGVSQRTLKKHLAVLGMEVLLNEARRLQVGEAFQEKRLIHEQEPIPARLVKKAYDEVL